MIHDADALALQDRPAALPKISTFREFLLAEAAENSRRINLS
jgi:hypothetical protein